METKTEVLKACTVRGLTIKLPDVQLERPLYNEVAGVLNKIGGKWKGGKISGFVFDEDPSELLKDIVEGKQRNIKNEFQFFETPPALADRIVALANIDSPDLLVLEPSAGRGAIVEALIRKEPRLKIQCYEKMETNIQYLKEYQNLLIQGNDFLNAKPILYDRIVANPPFSKNQDLQHITKMYYWLQRGGRMVSISSQHWLNSLNKKETVFRKWIQRLNAEIIPLDSSEVKESGANVISAIIVINKL